MSETAVHTMQRSLLVLLVLLVVAALLVAGAVAGALGVLIGAGVAQEWRRRANGSAQQTPQPYLVRSQLRPRA